MYDTGGACARARAHLHAWHAISMQCIQIIVTTTAIKNGFFRALKTVLQYEAEVLRARSKIKVKTKFIIYLLLFATPEPIATGRQLAA